MYLVKRLLIMLIPKKYSLSIINPSISKIMTPIMPVEQISVFKPVFFIKVDTFLSKFWILLIPDHINMMDARRMPIFLFCVDGRGNHFRYNIIE